MTDTTHYYDNLAARTASLLEQSAHIPRSTNAVHPYTAPTAVHPYTAPIAVHSFTNHSLPHSILPVVVSAVPLHVTTEPVVAPQPLAARYSPNSRVVPPVVVVSPQHPSTPSHIVAKESRSTQSDDGPVIRARSVGLQCSDAPLVVARRDVAVQWDGAVRRTSVSVQVSVPLRNSATSTLSAGQLADHMAPLDDESLSEMWIPWLLHERIQNSFLREKDEVVAHMVLSFARSMAQQLHDVGTAAATRQQLQQQALNKLATVVQDAKYTMSWWQQVSRNHIDQLSQLVHEQDDVIEVLRRRLVAASIKERELQDMADEHHFELQRLKSSFPLDDFITGISQKSLVADTNHAVVVPPLDEGEELQIDVMDHVASTPLRSSNKNHPAAVREKPPLPPRSTLPNAASIHRMLDAIQEINFED